MSELWRASRWQDASDPPEYAEHNAQMRFEAAREEIYQTLIGAIHSAGDAFAGIGLDADDAGGWIESAVEVADWAWYFEEENPFAEPPTDEVAARRDTHGWIENPDEGRS